MTCHHHHVTPYRIKNSCCHSKIPVFFLKPKINKKKKPKSSTQKYGPAFEFSSVVGVFVGFQQGDHQKHNRWQGKRACALAPASRAPLPRPHLPQEHALFYPHFSSSDSSCKHPTFLRPQSHTAPPVGRGCSLPS